MSTQAITNAGRALFASRQAANQPLNVDRFMLANINGLDHNTPVNRDEPLPQVQDQVKTLAVTKAGYIGPDEVVYSLYLPSNEGNFTYNWLGLLASDDTLIAVAYLAPINKEKSANGKVGNTLNENIMLAYTDAQAITSLSVEASSWQWQFDQGTEETRGLMALADQQEALTGDDLTKATSSKRVHEAFNQYGLGKFVVSDETDLNLYTVNGSYITPIAGLANLPSDFPQGRYSINVNGGATFYCGQSIALLTGGGVVRQAFRVYEGGVGWSEWMETISSGTLASHAQMNAGDSMALVPPVKVVSDFVASKITEIIGAAPDSLNVLDELAAALGDDPNFATTITNLVGTKVSISSIVNALTSSATNQPLSANQGRLLKNLITSLTNTINALSYASVGAAAASHSHSASQVTGLGASVTSSGTNGYGSYRLWSDGFKEMWVHDTASSNVFRTKYFPVAFTSVSTIRVSVCQLHSQAATGNAIVKTSSITKSYMQCFNSGSNGGAHYYICGY